MSNKRIEIKGIFFEGLDEMLAESINSAAKESKLSAEDFANKLQLELKGLTDSFNETVISFYITNNKFGMDKFILTHHKNQKSILEINKQSFHYFIFYIQASVVLYEKCCEILKKQKISSTNKLALVLYGIIVRRAEQIVSLLLDGYIDAAMIIWRSMYEYAVTLLVVAIENSNELNERYYDHSVKNSKRKILSYQSNYKELKFKPLPKSTDQRLQNQERRLEQKYGKDFLKNEWGWADNLFEKNKKANLRELEEKISLKKYRPYYILCSEQAHSNFNAFNNFMHSNNLILPLILQQESKKEAFIDPMQFTVSILQEVNDFLLYEFSHKTEFEVNSGLMLKLFKGLQETFE
jgi:hypothetical protein